MDNFGVQALGSRAYDLDQSKIQSDAAASVLNLAQAQNAGAMAQEHQAIAATKMEELRRQQQMSALMKQAYQFSSTPSEDDTPGAPMFKLAGMALRSGLFKDADRLFKTASIVDLRAARATESQATTAGKIFDNTRKAADATSRALVGVTDQDSFNRAITQLELETGMPSKYRGMEYSPELVKQIDQEALTTKDNAELARKQADAKALKAFRDARLKQHDAEIELRKKRANAYIERQERLTKIGGGSKNDKLGAPDKKIVDQVERFIKRDFPEITGGPTMRGEAATTIAAEAQRLMKQNPALDWNTAVGQAYEGSVKAGDFQSVKGMIGGKKHSYAAGVTASNPRPTPTGGASRMIGRFYSLPNGQVGKWTGKGWEVDNGTSALSGDNTSVDEDADDPDEDE